MSEEKKSFWDRLLSSPHEGEREQKVVEYICYRLKDGAHLREVLGEEYVKRNASSGEIEQILDNPRLIHAAYEQMHEDFSSGVLDPKKLQRGVAKDA